MINDKGHLVAETPYDLLQGKVVGIEEWKDGVHRVYIVRDFGSAGVDCLTIYAKDELIREAKEIYMKQSALLDFNLEKK